ncbi:MAG: phage tail tape measure C-terminal domain-containing protein [Hyphomicrobium sp.]|uniref:phage tail tape measure C-terminal domain-containing protein n=1 Tax=Hyphomicrobium sp. TaxID=82 RepID=UPI00356A858F
MPEAFSSIADMRVVIDSSTDKLEAGLTVAKNLVSRFASEGNDGLSLFDRALGRAAEGVVGLSGKLSLVSTAMRSFGGELLLAKEIGGALAERGGKADEWNAWWAAIEDVQAAFVGLATGQAIPASEEALKAYALAASHTSDGNQKLSGSFRGLGEPAVWGNIRALNEMSHTFRTMADESTWSVQTIDDQFRRLTLLLNQEAEGVRRDFANGQSLLGDLLGDDEVTERMEKMAGFLDKVRDLNERRRERQTQDASNAEGPAQEEFDKVVVGIENQVRALQEKANTYGMTAGEAAAYAAVMKVVNDLDAKSLLLTEEGARKLGELTDKIKILTDSEEARAKAKSNNDAAKRFLESIQHEIRGLQQQAEASGMSAAAAASYNAEMRLRNQLTDQDLHLTPEQRKEMEALIATLRKLTTARREDQDEQSQQRAFDQSIQQLQRQTAQIEGRTKALYDNSEAGRVQALVDQQLVSLQARHIELTPKRIDAIREQAQAQIEATTAQEDAQRAMRLLNDIGNAVTSNLDSAFRRWTNGSKVSVKEMAASILADLAEIQFKAAVLNPLANFLTGSQSGGGGLLGSLLGLGGSGGMPSTSSWAAGTSVIPAFADGGDFGPGPMMVGERGPELIWPTFPGKVIPNNALPNAAASSGPPVINMPVTINAQGAYPESIADIKAALAETQASIPQTAIEAWQQAKDRGVV